MSSSTYVIAFRDDSIQEIKARSVAVHDGSIQLLNDDAEVIAAFPKESVRGVYPHPGDPVKQDITYTAWDYAINHLVVPFIEENDLKVKGKLIPIDAVAHDVLEESDAYEGLQGFRLKVSDDEFAAVVKRWTHDPATHRLDCDFSPEGRHKQTYTLTAK